MGRYWINLVIAKDDAGDKRCRDLSTALFDECEPSGAVWNEGLSFFLIRRQISLFDLASEISAVLDPLQDIVLIGDIDKQRIVCIGETNSCDTLTQVFPFAQVYSPLDKSLKLVCG